MKNMPEFVQGARVRSTRGIVDIALVSPSHRRLSQGTRLMMVRVRLRELFDAKKVIATESRSTPNLARIEVTY